MPGQPEDASRPNRRRRLTPARRIHRFLVTGLCAGATLVGGALSADADQRLTNATLRSRNAATAYGHGSYYAPNACNTPHYSAPCPTCPEPHGPHYDFVAPPYPPLQGEDRESGDQGTGAQSDSFGMSDLSSTSIPPVSTPSLSGATGTPTAPASATPNLVGDFFGSSQRATVRILGGGPGSGSFQIQDPNESVTGRIKQAESYSPLPRDRVFLDYAAYWSVPIGPSVGSTPADISIQRFTPGIERTFFDQMLSIEVRMPVARTLDSSFSTADSSVDTDHWEAGNLNLALKALLFQNDNWAFTSGLGIRTPTAKDLKYSSGVNSLEVENQSVHLMPWFGALYTPNSPFFAQALIQVDVDANGNDVIVNAGAGDIRAGTLQDQTYLFSSFSVGAWLLDNPCAERLTSVATTLELHHSTTVQDPDFINNAGIIIAEHGANPATGAGADPDFDAFTGVIGLHLFYAGGAQVTFAYGVPIGNDKFADGEFRTLLSRYY